MKHLEKQSNYLTKLLFNSNWQIRRHYSLKISHRKFRYSGDHHGKTQTRNHKMITDPGTQNTF